jgi:hypothetical protein
MIFTIEKIKLKQLALLSADCQSFYQFITIHQYFVICYLGMPYWTECDTNFEATEPPSKPKIRHTLMNAVNATGKGGLISEDFLISEIS